MNDYLQFLRILRNSKEYSFDGTVLTIRSYRTGEEVKIDLAKLTKEEFENILNTEE